MHHCLRYFSKLGKTIPHLGSYENIRYRIYTKARPEQLLRTVRSELRLKGVKLGVFYLVKLWLLRNNCIQWEAEIS